MTFWIVRAGRHGEYEQVSLEKSLISIRWNELMDLSTLHNKEELIKLYDNTYPDEKKSSKSIRAGQVWRFLKEIKIGDLIALPLKTQSSIAIGKVTGNYVYDKRSTNTKHRRSVHWLEKYIPRSNFDQDILYSLGTLLTVAQIRSPDAEERIKNMLKKSSKTDQSIDTGKEETNELDLDQYSKDQIIKFIAKKFRGHGLARLIEGILKSKGYTTRLSPPGPDGGVDILASYGKFGFDDPKICIQVKSSLSPVDAKVLRELIGVTKKSGANYAILVAWGGLDKGATREINDLFFTTKLWDQGKIVDELRENYDNLDDEIQSEIPLKKIWSIIEE